MSPSNHHPIPVIAFVGRSGCGKTTLLENVIPHLIEQGIRVSVVKHTQHHNIESDAEGTDTRRMWVIGVPSVILVSADSVIHWERIKNQPQLNDVLAKITAVDLIVLEGFKKSAVPKIEVLREAHYATPLSDLDSRIAYVTDIEDLSTDIPCFALDGFKALAEFLIQFTIKNKR